MPRYTVFTVSRRPDPSDLEKIQVFFNPVRIIVEATAIDALVQARRLFPGRELATGLFNPENQYEQRLDQH